MPHHSYYPVIEEFYPARKNVLLLTCMDLRLLDNVVDFMDACNLKNRYDQLVFAGAALGVIQGSSPPAWGGSGQASWKDVFFGHLETAIEKLHREIHDIYIVEHRACGAYKVMPPYLHDYLDDPNEQRDEKRDHRQQAHQLEQEIANYCAKQAQNSDTEAWHVMRVTSFLMDLNGQIEMLT